MLPVEEPVLSIPITEAPAARALRTFSVARGDVRLYSNLPAFVVPAREERLSFWVDGLMVASILVDVGDTVQEGDIIAILDFPSAEEQLQNAQREKEWINLEITHLEERRTLARTINNHTKAQQYSSEIAYLREQLKILERQIDYLQNIYEKRYLYSPIDGTVTSIITFYEGMTSDTQQVVAVIADQTQSVFVVRGTDWLHVTPGDHFAIFINQEPLLAKAIDPIEFGVIRHGELSNDIYLIIIDDYLSELTDISHATVHIERKAAHDVLFIPLTAINRTSTRTFVYVISDDVRTVRDVEIGLWGNSALEITSGLDEGEIVVNE